MRKMMKKLGLASLFTLLLFSYSKIAFAQEFKPYFYEGTVGNRAVRFYLKQLPNECGGDDTFVAMYQYGKGKNWIELLVQKDKNNNFCFTEIRFTGVLIVKKNNVGLFGTWISPDGARRLSVSLNLKQISKKEIDELEDRLEVTHYENFDC